MLKWKYKADSACCFGFVGIYGRVFDNVFLRRTLQSEADSESCMILWIYAEEGEGLDRGLQEHTVKQTECVTWFY